MHEEERKVWEDIYKREFANSEEKINRLCKNMDDYEDDKKKRSTEKSSAKKRQRSNERDENPKPRKVSKNVFFFRALNV